MAGGGHHDADADNVDTNADDADADDSGRGWQYNIIYILVCLGSCSQRAFYSPLDVNARQLRILGCNDFGS